jgi:hypothetical protein
MEPDIGRIEDPMKISGCRPIVGVDEEAKETSEERFVGEEVVTVQDLMNHRFVRDVSRDRWSVGMEKEEVEDERLEGVSSSPADGLRKRVLGHRLRSGSQPLEESKDESAAGSLVSMGGRREGE